MEVYDHHVIIPEITTPNPPTLTRVVRLTLPDHVDGPLSLLSWSESPETTNPVKQGRNKNLRSHVPLPSREVFDDVLESLRVSEGPEKQYQSGQKEDVLQWFLTETEARESFFGSDPDL